MTIQSNDQLLESSTLDGSIDVLRHAMTVYEHAIHKQRNKGPIMSTYLFSLLLDSVLLQSLWSLAIVQNRPEHWRRIPPTRNTADIQNNARCAASIKQISGEYNNRAGW